MQTPAARVRDLSEVCSSFSCSALAVQLAVCGGLPVERGRVFGPCGPWERGGTALLTTPRMLDVSRPNPPPKSVGRWARFEDNFPWLKFESDGGLRKRQHTNFGRWRMELAAAIWCLHTGCTRPDALRRYGCGESSLRKSRDAVGELGRKIKGLGEAGHLPGWQAVVADPPTVPEFLLVSDASLTSSDSPMFSDAPASDPLLTSNPQVPPDRPARGPLLMNKPLEPSMLSPLQKSPTPLANGWSLTGARHHHDGERLSARAGPQHGVHQDAPAAAPPDPSAWPPAWVGLDPLAGMEDVFAELQHPLEQDPYAGEEDPLGNIPLAMFVSPPDASGVSMTTRLRKARDLLQQVNVELDTRAGLGLPALSADQRRVLKELVEVVSKLQARVNE